MKTTCSCPICAEIFNGDSPIVSTPCGHVFHETCITQWLRRSKTCPTCRQKVAKKPGHKLYFTHTDEDSDDSQTKLNSELEAVKADLAVKDSEILKHLADLEVLRKAVTTAENKATSNFQKLVEFRDQANCKQLEMKQQLEEASKKNKLYLGKVSEQKNTIEDVKIQNEGEVMCQPKKTRVLKTKIPNASGAGLIPFKKPKMVAVDPEPLNLTDNNNPEDQDEGRDGLRMNLRSASPRKKSVPDKKAENKKVTETSE